jgi:hypothetical protein
MSLSRSPLAFWVVIHASKALTKSVSACRKPNYE